MSRPPEHLVDDGLDEEDEEKAEAEEELGEGIFQLQHCSRHHPQPRRSLQGLPHLEKYIKELERNLTFWGLNSYLAQHVDEHGGDENTATET